MIRSIDKIFYLLPRTIPRLGTSALLSVERWEDVSHCLVWKTCWNSAYFSPELLSFLSLISTWRMRSHPRPPTRKEKLQLKLEALVRVFTSEANSILLPRSNMILFSSLCIMACLRRRSCCCVWDFRIPLWDPPDLTEFCSESSRLSTLSSLSVLRKDLPSPPRASLPGTFLAGLRASPGCLAELEEEEVEAVELDVEVCLPMSVSFGFSKLSDLRPPRGARGGLSIEPSGANFFRGAKAGFLPIGPRGACQEETSISSSWWLPGISYQGHHGSVRLL